jgi:hypothetical protein
MPRLRRKAKRRTSVTVLQYACLSGTWKPHEPAPEGAEEGEHFFWRRGELQAAWEVVGGEITEQWIREQPGTRPPAWWYFERGVTPAGMDQQPHFNTHPELSFPELTPADQLEYLEEHGLIGPEERARLRRRAR